MKAPRRSRLHLMWAVAAALVVAGCACLPAAPREPAARPAAALPAESSWWYARFKLHWPEDTDPAWHTDLLIAELVLKPILDRHASEIGLWRFHRRAARDAAGHQFSFIFFAAPETARRVYLDISLNPVLEQARAAGRVIAVVCDDPAAPARPAIADASDPGWSPALRQAWPRYLMGASQMWLDLVCGMAPSEPPPASPPNFDALDERYRGINAAISALWQNEGQHAFLHHLNALFGYEPILVIEKRLMRF